ncbi:SMP-30/gluconolactonase/LRE family protein [Flagellimonas sp.]|uniref:SMP-30/gluconolactonase/LRE family protein n=1 Tax=Flagellimonas sp. TaxID=2058762 RepID=UPI003F4A427C
MKKFCSFFFLLGAICHGQEKMDFILKEKDLIPEGTAYNIKEKTIYIGSVYRQKIIGIDSTGKEFEVIGSQDFGILSPIGMEYDESTKTLWVCAALAPIVNKSGEAEWITTILAFDMGQNNLKKKYREFGYATQLFLNDLTVASDSSVYATESVNGWIYKIDPETDTLQKWLELDGYTFSNGIVYDPSANVLFVAVDQGILRIDPKTEQFQLLDSPEGMNSGGIDGLCLYKDYFIGHQSTKITKFYFNKQKTKLISAEILDSGKEFDSSTTGELGGGYYHYIVNSQIRSGVNQKAKRIKPMDSLEPVIIRKLKL